MERRETANRFRSSFFPLLSVFFCVVASGGEQEENGHFPVNFCFFRRPAVALLAGPRTVNRRPIVLGAQVSHRLLRVVNKSAGQSSVSIKGSHFFASCTCFSVTGDVLQCFPLGGHYFVEG